MNDRNMNPQIKELTIGIRELRTITVYPLSVADQLKMSQIVLDALNVFFSSKDKKINDTEFMAFLQEFLFTNLGKIIKLATDESEEVLEEMTNLQASELAKIIYEVNYDLPIKNVKSLFEKSKKVSPSKRPSPTSAKGTEDTD